VQVIVYAGDVLVRELDLRHGLVLRADALGELDLEPLAGIDAELVP
jgi:hypothetical protein